MNQYNTTLAKLLTYSGTLPLIGCAFAMALSLTIIDVEFFARAYSAVIISFLCGIHWAIYLFYSAKCPRNLLISSNIIALLAWLFLIIPPSRISLLLQPLCFLYLLTLDMKLHDAGILPEWFYKLRRNATVVVLFCLSIIIWLS